MYLKIQKITKDLIEQSKNYFPKKYLESLKNKQEESIVARFLISKLVEENFGIKNFLPEVDENGIPVFKKNIFWSISHKKGIVFIGISDEIFGVDIEIIKKREESLFNIFSEKEYQILGGKSWENFYVLWTAKEAIIKKNLGKLDDMKNLVLENLLTKGFTPLNIYKGNKKIIFEKKLIISGEILYSKIEKDIVYAVSL